MKNILLIVYLLLVGCETLAKMSPNYIAPITPPLRNYEGQVISKAQADFGYDYTTKTLPDGKTAYTWKQQGAMKISRDRFPGTSQVLSAWCTFSFIADSNGTIVSVHAKGTACQ